MNVFFSNDDLVDLTEKGNLTLQLPKTQNGSIVLPVSIQSSRSLIDPSLFGSLMRFDGSGKEMFFFTIPTAGTCKFSDGNELVYDSEKIIPGCTDIVAKKSS